MSSPLSRAWTTLTRYPALALVPLLWEALMSWPVLLLGGAPNRAPGQGFSVKFLLPQPLPSGGELIGRSVSISTDFLGGVPLVALILTTMLGAFVTAGYLHLLTGALQGSAPSWERFKTGAKQFGGRLLLWNLLVLAVFLLLLLLTAPIPPIGIMVGLLLTLVYFLAPFLIVVADLSIPETVAGAPGTLSAHLGALLPVCLACVALSVLFSFGLTAMGLGSLLVASPLWAWFGSWVTLGVLAVLAVPHGYA